MADDKIKKWKAEEEERTENEEEILLSILRTLPWFVIIGSDDEMNKWKTDEEERSGRMKKEREGEGKTRPTKRNSPKIINLKKTRRVFAGQEGCLKKPNPMEKNKKITK